MPDLKSKIKEILSEPQLAVLATVTDDDKPWCRYVLIFTDEDMMIRLATNVETRKIEQIRNNPEVHLTCGVKNPFEPKNWLQIQGQASLNTSNEIKHVFWYDMLERIFEGPDDPLYGVIEIKPYTIEYVEAGQLEPEILEL